MHSHPPSTSILHSLAGPTRTSHCPTYYSPRHIRPCKMSGRISMSRPRQLSSTLALSFLSCWAWSGQQAHAFTVPSPEVLGALQHAVSDPSTAQHALDQFSTGVSSSTTTLANSLPVDLLSAYKSQLAAHPLPTKMMTGATVALMGDALAQSRDVDVPYDRRRAASFMTFDACYRWLQHETYPAIVANLKGQYLGGLIAAIPPLSQAAKALSEAGARRGAKSQG